MVKVQPILLTSIGKEKWEKDWG